MKNQTFPARLHVLVAKNSKDALVIRRGPSHVTGVFNWNRKHNSVRVAQWFKGRIYERRSDLSPDGKHWIYFAMNGKWQSEAKGAWTAIARAPWLKAIALFPKGDCWQGGGLFLDDKHYWLNGAACHSVLKQTTEVIADNTFQPSTYYNAECLGVYFVRLQRDGWTLEPGGKNVRLDSETLFNKHLKKQWQLRKICHGQIGQPQGKSVYWDEHVLFNHHGDNFSKPDWEWAEYVDENIYYAEKGCLYKLPILTASKLGEPALVHDFNAYSFENLQAPY